MKQEHEMTPGVLVSGEVLSAGDARARVAVLEAENAELRKRVCVPDGYVVVPVEPTEGMRRAGFVAVERADGCYNHDESDECPHCGDGFGKPDGCGSRAVIGYRAMLAASPAPVERVEQEAVTDRSELLRLVELLGSVACAAFRAADDSFEDFGDDGAPVISCGIDQMARLGDALDACDAEPEIDDSYARDGWLTVLDKLRVALTTPQPAPTAAQDVAGLPFVRKILEKLERFRECAEDDEGVDIGRNWLEMLTHLGLLNRVQRSPARWEMTAQADDALEAAHQQREVERCSH